MSKVLDKFVEQEYRSRKVPDFKVGDVVKVHQIVPDVQVEKKLSKTAKAIKKTQQEEGGPGFRTQIFEGTVIAQKHGREPGATFTVRKIATGNIGVEKIFPLYSPLVEKIEVVSRPTKRVRRSKLYFLRGRVGKRARRLGVGTAVDQEVTSVEQLASEEGLDGDEEQEIKKEELAPTSPEKNRSSDQSVGEGVEGEPEVEK